MNETEFSVIEAYLINNWSHRRIQSEILGIEAPQRGGGFEAMKILHKFEIKEEHKNMLNGQVLDRNLFEQVQDIQSYLEQSNI